MLLKELKVLTQTPFLASFSCWSVAGTNNVLLNSRSISYSEIPVVNLLCQEQLETLWCVVFNMLHCGQWIPSGWIGLNNCAHDILTATRMTLFQCNQFQNPPKQYSGDFRSTRIWLILSFKILSAWERGWRDWQDEVMLPGLWGYLCSY